MFNVKLSTITLAKFVSAFVTIVIISGVKFGISGEFHLEYGYFFSNVAIGLLAWIVNLNLISLLTDWLNLNGINFNLKELLFGFHVTENSKLDIKKFKIKRYNAMESDEESGSGKRLDKGKGVDREQHPFYGSELSKPYAAGNIADNVGDNKLDKSTKVTSEPAFALFHNVFPGLDPMSLIHPNRVNPGPGFNVPGGEVPIRDDICKHIDYNGHILSQFKKMDLEVAIQQRNNNLLMIQVLENKLAFAQNALANIPTIPTTEYEFRLKNKIISDLNDMHNKKIRGEARVTLLNSRIEFIEINK